MKNFYNIKLLLLACLVLTLGFLTSCDEQNETPNNGQVQLLSFGPTGAKHGEKIRFIGHNLDKVTSVVMPGATVDKAQFTSQSAEQIELVVPNAATKGKLTLKVAGGEDIVTKTELSFEVPVTISTFTAQARPGADITLTGNFLNWVEGVKFGDDPDIVKTFVSQSMTQLVVTVPADAKTGKLTVLTGGTEPLAIETQTEFVVVGPAVTTMDPNPVKHGDNLTLTGTNLDLVHSVNFVGGAKVTSFVSQSPTQIVVAVPNTARKGKLTLVTKASLTETMTAGELNITLPAITAVAPATLKHGETLTISGTNLDLVKTVMFAGNANVSTFTSQSATEIVLTVPDNAQTGALKVRTIKDFEVTTTNTVTITLPAVTRVSPNPVSPGATLIITGTNLDLVKTVQFTGGETSAFASQTPTQITLAVPTTAKNGVLKLVTIRNFTVTTTANVEIILPIVTSFSPRPVGPRGFLTISGANLELVKSITFVGGTTVKNSSFLGQSETQIVVQVPGNAVTGQIKFTTHSGFEVTPTQELEIGGALPPLPALGYVLYDDARRAGWDDWGWGGTRDWNSTEKVRMGSKSAKMTYVSTGSYGAIRWRASAGNAFSTAGYSEFSFSIFGMPGTGGKTVNIVTNEAWGSPYQFQIVEGEWRTYNVPLSSLGNHATIGDILFQTATDWPGVIYLDHVGFR